MPFPEHVSWDRKDVYRDRRPLKSDPLSASPVAPRWYRDSPPSFNYRGNHHAPQGFADYRRPPGRGRPQSDWHMFPEESGYGYMPSRSCERVVDDRGYWTSSSSRVDGRYMSGTDYYKVRGYQKDWEGSNWQHNNSSSAGKPFNGPPVFYGGKPCNGFSDMPAERRHNGMYPGFGVERQFNGTPVVSNGRPSNGFRNGFSGPSVLRTHSQNTPNIAIERPNNSGDRTSDVISSPLGVKASNKLSRIAADGSNSIEKTGNGCCSIVSAERPTKLLSSVSRDMPNIGPSGAPVQKTPNDIYSSLAEGDVTYHKPSSTSVGNVCNGYSLSSAAESTYNVLPVASEEKPCNIVVSASSTNILNGMAETKVIDLPQANSDAKLSNSEHASDCLQMVSECQNKLSEKFSKHQHGIEAGEIIESCNVSKNEKENFLGANWKPLLWTRSGSLSSHSHSGSSKSVPADSKATVDESLQIEGTTPFSLAGDTKSGEAPTSKKARLGWGQGLAKYERKIVDDPPGCGKQNDVQSPRVVVKCTSPATPATATCSLSPENEYISLREGNTPDSPNLTGSDKIPSSFEKLNMSFITNEVHLLLNTIHSDDQCPTGFGLERTNAVSKLLLWKTDILKAVELTESEIESLEGEIQSSKSENRNSIHRPAASSLLHIKTSVIPTPLQVNSSKVREDVDSPGMAISNPVVPSLMVENASTKSSHLMFELTQNQDISQQCPYDGNTPLQHRNDPVRTNLDLLDIEESRLCEFIFAANKEEARKAYDELAQLPTKNRSPVSICHESTNDTLIRDEVAKRNKMLTFTERAVTLKYRALQQLWKEDARLLEIRKNRSKSSKRLDLRTKTSRYANLTSNLLRSRVSSSEGSTKLVPPSQTVSLTSNLLSEIPVTVYKDELKMPPLILDAKEKQMSRFVSYNGLVEDPVAVEKERAVMNPWMPDEKETFLDKYSLFGKDFRKIASYLDHKTTADCVEFYYKNHKSPLFKRTRKKPVRVGTQSKSVAKAAFMLTSGREKWDQERLAADVLTGISGFISSEAISPCVSSSFNHADVHRQWKRKKVGGKRKRTWTNDVTPNNDETCSGESCGEMGFSAVDWTDEEKHLLLQAVKVHGNDFELVSKFVKTRYSNECKAFYSKVKKRLGSTLTATDSNDSKQDIDVRLATPVLEPIM